MSDQFTLGEHDALISTLLKGQTEILDRVTKIEVHMAERRGERRVALWTLTTVAGVVGAAVTSLVQAVVRHHNP
jgi:hypothetical protein